MGAVSVQPETKNLRWRENLASAWRISRQVFRGLWRAHNLITLVLVVVLLISAIAVVYTVHLNRERFSQLNHLQAQRDADQRTWSQLLLEQSALSSHNRVEQRAVNELDMKVPGKDSIQVVQAPQ